MHESNGLDIVISLVINEIKPLADTNVNLALEIKVWSFLDFGTGDHFLF